MSTGCQWNGRGAANVRAKLTPRKVRWVKANPLGLTVAQLADRCNVSRWTISAIRHGRRWANPTGPRSYTAKLDPQKVRRMRRLVAEGMTITAAAELFEVSKATASQVANRVTWRDV